MSSSTDKTPSRDEQLRKLLEEAKEDQLEHEKAMEDMVMRSAEKSKRMSDALEGLLGWTQPDDQLAENLENKMETAVDHPEPVRFEPLDASVYQLWIYRIVPHLLI